MENKSYLFEDCCCFPFPRMAKLFLESRALFLVSICIGPMWARSVVDFKSSAISMERPLPEREIPLVESVDGERTDEAKHNEAKGPSREAGATDTNAGMRISVRVHPRLLLRPPKVHESGTDTDQTKSVNRRPLAELKLNKTPVLEPKQEHKIDEYEEDPFEGVTSWPLPEMPMAAQKEENGRATDAGRDEDGVLPRI